jgi:hypothetical protein
MGQLSPILRNGRDANAQLFLSFWCLGCDEVHAVKIAEDGKPGWTWNGSAEAPTFGPSIAVSSGCRTPSFDPATGGCWCTFNAERIAKGEEPCSFKCSMCHSYVTDGRIEFLSDCTHHLVGQTVDLPAWSEGAL